MNLKRTPLYDEHLRLGAQIVPFAGWEMPVKYEGIIPEHLHCRHSASLFDVSHMGEILISGSGAEASINYLCCNDVTRISINQAQYSAILNEQGGVIDDLIIYKLGEEKFLLCVNASNIDQDFQWISSHALSNTKVENLSNEYGQIAIQGPRAEEMLAKICPATTGLKYFYCQETSYQNQNILIARTGYTGEDGFEIYLPSNLTINLWQELMLSGAGVLKPAGLGARDTLRLEAAFPLHGHELSPSTPALSSGLGWIVKFKKENFIGKDALLALQEYPKLVGIELLDAGIAREGTKVFSISGQEIGIVTSGTKTPSLNKSICLAILREEYTELNQELNLEVRGKKLLAKTCRLPFYKRR